MPYNLIVTADSKDVTAESRFNTLNTRGFVRGATVLHQWYLLVSEACAASSAPIHVMMKDYLVIMLYRFMPRPELLQQLAAFDMGEHILGVAKTSALSMEDVADISLQYVAFFPERSYNRHQPRSLEYVANVGIRLYEELARASRGKDDWGSRAFQVMATSFARAVMLLRYVWPKFVLLERQSPDPVLISGALYLPNLSEIMKLTSTKDPVNGLFSQKYLQFKGSK